MLLSIKFDVYQFEHLAINYAFYHSCISTCIIGLLDQTCINLIIGPNIYFCTRKMWSDLLSYFLFKPPFFILRCFFPVAVRRKRWRNKALYICSNL